MKKAKQSKSVHVKNATRETPLSRTRRLNASKKIAARVLELVDRIEELDEEIARFAGERVPFETLGLVMGVLRLSAVDTLRTHYYERKTTIEALRRSARHVAKTGELGELEQRRVFGAMTMRVTS